MEQWHISPDFPLQLLRLILSMKSCLPRDTRDAPGAWRLRLNFHCMLTQSSVWFCGFKKSELFFDKGCCSCGCRCCYCPFVSQAFRPRRCALSVSSWAILHGPNPRPGGHRVTDFFLDDVTGKSGQPFLSKEILLPEKLRIQALTFSILIPKFQETNVMT